MVNEKLSDKESDAYKRGFYDGYKEGYESAVGRLRLAFDKPVVKVAKEEEKEGPKQNE